jgi:hypothetical protein
MVPPVHPWGCGPFDTVKFTVVEGATLVPAAGFWLITSSAAMVSLYTWLTVPGVKPALVIAASAAVWVCPTTSGTMDCV